MSRLAVMILIAATSVGRAQTTGQDNAAVTLAPGDQLRIAVWGHPEFSGDFLIAPDGVITHPVLRDVRAAGVPMPQLESRVRTFLTRYIAEPAFVMTPLLHVFVGGEVRTPSTYVTLPGTRLDQAILLAGGPLATSRLDSVVLVRDRQRTILNLAGDLNGFAATPVHSGDELFVPRTEERSWVQSVLLPTISVIGVLTGIANLVVTLSRH